MKWVAIAVAIVICGVATFSRSVGDHYLLFILSLVFLFISELFHRVDRLKRK